MVSASDLSVSITPAASVPQIADIWRDLETRADTSFFLSWNWIGCWLKESGASPYLLTARHQDRVVALALLQPSAQRRHKILHTKALMLNQVGNPDIDIITIEHNGILVDRDVAAAAQQACITFLTRHQGSRDGLPWDELHLGGLAAPETLRPLADQAGLTMWYHSFKPSWVVDLAAIRESGGDYLDTLSANTRYQIRRAIRLYEKRGKLTATPARDLDEAMRFFDEMKDLHQKYWEQRGHPGSFYYPFFAKFHRALIAECFANGTIELVCVAAGGEPIGYVYNFIYNDWVCAYHTGFRYEEDPKLKPGLVSHYLCIAYHLAHGRRLYDFLAGGERYKSNLASPGPNIAYLVLQRPILKLRAENTARRLKSAGLERWLAGHPAGKAAQSGSLMPPRSTAHPSRGKVLVLGDDTRSFLAIVRSLGRQQIEVHAAPANFASPALKSRYIARTHYLPYWMDDGAEWLQAMETLLRAEQFDLIIPCNETTLLPIQHNRARLAALTRLAIPDDRAIAALFDKHDTRELARSVGVAVSPGRLPRPGETAEAVFQELGAPVVVKPRRSYALTDLVARGKVQVLPDADALRPLMSHLDPADFLYEGFFAGRGAGVSVLTNAGNVLQAFEHHRVHESGASGSYYRVSAPVTPVLEQACASIVAALGYTGVAMFEFRLPAQTGAAPRDWVLLEVNARPWGSMPLPVGLGVDFPYRWYQLLVHGIETPPVAYRTGIYARNLIPDLWSMLSDARQARTGQPSPGLGRVLELGRIVTGREFHDVLTRDDPKPGLAELGGLARQLLGRIGRKLPSSARRTHARARDALRQAIRSADGGPVRILFVCQGNICRSPFAAAALRRHLPASVPIEVASYGMMPRPGRPTPPLGIAAAAVRGLDLQAHRSAHLSRPQALSATAILVFDEINRRAILDRYPDLRAPVIRLGDLAPEPIGPIADPIDGTAEVFDATYGAIETSVAALADIVKAATR